MRKSLHSTAAFLALFVLSAPSSPRAAEPERELIRDKASATFVDGSGQRHNVHSNETQLTIVRVESGNPDKASKAASSVRPSSGGLRLAAEIADTGARRAAPADANLNRP